jgi:hypothetical protein
VVLAAPVQAEVPSEIWELPGLEEQVEEHVEI